MRVEKLEVGFCYGEELLGYVYAYIGRLYLLVDYLCYENSCLCRWLLTLGVRSGGVVVMRRGKKCLFVGWEEGF